MAEIHGRKSLPSRVAHLYRSPDQANLQPHAWSGMSRRRLHKFDPVPVGVASHDVCGPSGPPGRSIGPSSSRPRKGFERGAGVVDLHDTVAEPGTDLHRVLGRPVDKLEGRNLLWRKPKQGQRCTVAGLDAQGLHSSSAPALTHFVTCVLLCLPINTIPFGGRGLQARRPRARAPRQGDRQPRRGATPTTRLERLRDGKLFRRRRTARPARAHRG